MSLILNCDMSVIIICVCLTAFFRFTLAIEHVPGIWNGPADSVSRGKMD